MWDPWSLNTGTKYADCMMMYVTSHPPLPPHLAHTPFNALEQILSDTALGHTKYAGCMTMYVP